MTSNIHIPAKELELIEVHGVTRSSFMLRSALAAGAVYGLGAVTPFVGSAVAQSDMGDIEIVNFALTLEYLESEFYKVGQKLDLSSDVMKVAEEFGEHESQHVDALIKAVEGLGGTPAPKPEFAFGVKDEKSFLKLAQVLEDTGVGAYNGAAPSIKSKEILGAAGTIVQIEARHAAQIRLINKAAPAPDSFDKAIEKDKVLAAVTPLIKA